ncbi:hypothetical protein R2083_14920 [Nitrosomonas sp. Is35]|uniref:hypothetical protein n=1 Tax=Nitrosomonas sp. Is35 TaxID=3080534 RepID=UPI00294B7596|nr:hypothetical protein [Nitrosomonas sp. Is35]MDV6348811.1 hypothetical protein [Nitrosomonas sp. Is35]
MTIEDTIKKRIEELLSETAWLTQSDDEGATISDQQRHECSAWLVSAQHIIYLICAEIKTPYLARANNIAEKDHGWLINLGVGEMAALLRTLLADANAGLLSSIADRARAETFDDFLDHADKYLADQRKNESGVIAGVVFEDTLRRICRRLNIIEKGVKLDALISELSSHGELSAIKAKRARVAAHVRTKASHAQWEEFESSDVQATIEFTRELVSSKLDG